jgi:hypothetical protein
MFQAGTSAALPARISIADRKVVAWQWVAKPMLGQPRHLGMTQLPRRPRPRDPRLGYSVSELFASDLRVRNGVVPGAEDVDDPDRLPAVHGPPLSLLYLVVAQQVDELIADLVGHKDIATTRMVYRLKLKPVITGGAKLIDDAVSDWNSALKGRKVV